MIKNRRRILLASGETPEPVVIFHPSGGGDDLYLYKWNVGTNPTGLSLGKTNIPSSWGTTIPGSIELCEGFTAIGNDCFKSKSALTSVSVPSTLESIGNFAFSGCTSLVSIIGLSSSACSSIGRGCFLNCSALTSISFPQTITSIPAGGSTSDGVFCNCTSLTSITFSGSLLSIGAYFAYGCSSLASIDIPSTVNSIGNFAFQASGLVSITLPNSVTAINTQLFQSCQSLTTVVLGNKVNSIGSGAFRNCTALTSITCTTLTRPSLGGNAFDNTKYVKSAAYGGKIYVPSEALSSWQTTSGNWTSTIIGHITSIV